MLYASFYHCYLVSLQAYHTSNDFPFQDADYLITELSSWQKSAGYSLTNLHTVERIAASCKP